MTWKIKVSVTHKNSDGNSGILDEKVLGIDFDNKAVFIA